MALFRKKSKNKKKFPTSELMVWEVLQKEFCHICVLKLLHCRSYIIKIVNAFYNVSFLLPSQLTLLLETRTYSENATSKNPHNMDELSNIQK